MYQLYVEVENAPLAEATGKLTKEQAKAQILDWFDLYGDIDEKVTIESTYMPDKGVDPDVPHTEPFGQHFVGIVDTYPALSKAIVAKAEGEISVEQRRQSVMIRYAFPIDKEEYVAWPFTSLPAEHAYVLYRKLRSALFGSHGFNKSFDAKE